MAWCCHCPESGSGAEFLERVSDLEMAGLPLSSRPDENVAADAKAKAIRLSLAAAAEEETTQEDTGTAGGLETATGNEGRFRVNVRFALEDEWTNILTRGAECYVSEPTEGAERAKEAAARDSNADAEAGFLFPMWTLPTSAFLTMRGTPQHHQELMRLGALVRVRRGEPDAEAMLKVFVSHQWLQERHPDPAGEQLAAVREALQGMARRTLTVSTAGGAAEGAADAISPQQKPRRMAPNTLGALSAGLLWYDWFSVPQGASYVTLREYVEREDSRKEELLRAITSVPAYIAGCDLFLVACPPLRHLRTRERCSFASWKRRGWCRFEMCCRALLVREESAPDMIVVSSATQARYVRPQILGLPPASDSAFSIEGDRAVVSKMLAQALRGKIEQQAGDWTLRKALFALAPRLSGVPTLPDERSPLEALLARYAFTSERDTPADGLGPLACAVLERNEEVVRQLLEANPRAVLTRLPRGCAEISLLAGDTPLHMAALYSSADVIQVLVAARADVGARNSVTATPLHYCGQALGRERGLAEALLAAGASLEARGPLQTTPMMVAAQFDATLVQTYLELKACVDAENALGMAPLELAAISSAPAAVSKLLLDAGAQANRRMLPRGVLGTAVNLAALCNYRAQLYLAATEVAGSTALHMGALVGDEDLCELLLQHQADPLVKNAWGRTPLDLARREGHSASLRRTLSKQ